MSNLEHYFENLLYHGEDIKGEANKNALTEEQQKSVEQCAQYVIYSLFGTREHFDEWINRDAASPWHRVEDELPKEKNWVLVWHTGYTTPKKAKFIVDVIPEFLFDGGGGAWELDGWSDNKGKVTHWMPLPEPPQEDA